MTAHRRDAGLHFGGEDVAVNFVDQHVRADGRGEFTDARHGARVDGDTAGIVRTGKDDELGARRDLGRDFVGIDCMTILEATGEAHDARAEEIGGGEHAFVGWRLEENLVTGREERRHHEGVGHRGARRDGDHVGRDAVAGGDGFAQRRVTLGVGAVEDEVGRREREIAEAAAENAAIRQIVAGGGVALCPSHVDAGFHGAFCSRNFPDHCQSQ